MSKLHVTLLWMTLTISGSLASMSRVCRIGDQLRHSDGLCGDTLTQVMSHICGNYYKRSIPRLPNKNEHNNPEFSKVFLKRSEALSFMNNGTHENGIVCECCQHRCKLSEMIEYCPKARVYQMRLRHTRNPDSPIRQHHLPRLIDLLRRESPAEDYTQDQQTQVLNYDMDDTEMPADKRATTDDLDIWWN